jgi:glycosyltransferase involved in cell wall biosynthesis
MQGIQSTNSTAPCGSAGSPVRVLYINPFSQQVSGPDESLRTLLKALAGRGVEPHLVIPRPGPQVARYQELGVQVHYAPISIMRRSVSPAMIGAFGANLLRGTRAIVAIARRVGADLIHTNMEVVLDGALAARWLRIPHVLHYRGNSLDEPRRVFDLLTAVWTGLSDRVFCISDATASIFIRRGRGAKVSTLYNPIDLAAFASASRSPEARASFGAGENDILVGAVGRIHPRKDLDTFVRAAALAARGRPQARFVVVGAAEGASEESYLAELRATTSKLGLDGRLIFAGARHDMPATFKALDLLVLTSRHEGFGRVVGEAMATGLPSVVTREGALPELVIDGTHGLCAAPADAEDFGTKIARLIDDATMRARFGAAARTRARAFDALACAERVLTTYRDLIATARPHSPTTHMI